MLQENIEFYRDLIEHLPEPTLVQKGRRIMLINQAAVAMHATRTADEPVGRDFLDFIHPDTRAQIANTAKTADIAVVHGIVAARGGVITVSSEPGEGAEFCIYRPVARAAADAEANTVKAFG